MAIKTFIFKSATLILVKLVPSKWYVPSKWSSYMNFIHSLTPPPPQKKKSTQKKHENSVIVYSPSYHSKPVCLTLFCGTSKIFKKMLVTKLFWWPLTSIVCTKNTKTFLKIYYFMFQIITNEWHSIYWDIEFTWHLSYWMIRAEIAFYFFFILLT